MENVNKGGKMIKGILAIMFIIYIIVEIIKSTTRRR